MVKELPMLRIQNVVQQKVQIDEFGGILLNVLNFCLACNLALDLHLLDALKQYFIQEYGLSP